MFGRVSHYLTAAVVALAPLPFGSVEPIWGVVWCLLLAVAVSTTRLRELRPVHVALLAPVLAVAVLYGMAVWLQSHPVPTVAEPNPIWSRAEGVLQTPMPRRISVSVSQPWSSLGVPLLMLLAFLGGFLMSIERQGASLLLRAAALSGAAYAFYGMASFLLDPASLLWKEKFAYLDSLTGTFVNRNTAAAYFGTCAVLWLVLGLWEMEKRLSHGSSGRSDLAVLLHRPPRKLVLSGICFLGCLAAVLMTQSRAGTLLTLGALLVSGVLLSRRRLSGYAKPFLAVGIASVAGILLLELWGGGVAFRIGSYGLTDLGRLEAYRSTLSIIGDHPLLGTGLGTFADVYPAYRSAEISTMGVWDRAHSTPLELAAEIGLPVAAAVVALWSFGLFRLFRGSLERRRDSIYPIAATGVAFLGTSHSLVDFSLQIPGYAIVFAAVVGCGLAQSVRSAPSGATERSRLPSPVAA
ncbi:MAG TPA: O-antigen ligase family protein [Microvirga sp.]|nr:O-antigen ligase family protein [Microvirga sp.]